jgi:pimeloyl-ACP methyl ester carboxylesterase
MNNSMEPTTTKQTDRVQGTAGQLYVDDKGIGEMPVVFTHSFLGNTMHWQHQLNFLRKNRRAVAFDFRSHGKSDPALGNHYSAEDLAEDIDAVVNQHHLERFVLVGHSMGGTAAIAYAGLHPQRVAGLVLSGTPGKSDEQQANTIVASLKSDAYDQVMEQYMKQLLDHSTPGVEAMVRNEMPRLSKDSSIAIVSSLFQFDPLPVLKRYKGPVIIISTERENQQPTSLHNQLPDIPNKEFKNTSHWMQMDKPDEFNRIISEFLKERVDAGS